MFCSGVFPQAGCNRGWWLCGCGVLLYLLKYIRQLDMKAIFLHSLLHKEGVSGFSSDRNSVYTSKNYINKSVDSLNTVGVFCCCKTIRPSVINHVNISQAI